MTKLKQSSIVIVTVVILLIILSGCHPVNSDVQEPLNNLNLFTAYDGKDEIFTQDDFADYDLTVICFWAPWSDASIYELKHLVALSQKFPENISFVSVCLDSSLDESKSRLTSLDLKGFITLYEGDGDFKAMSDDILNVPTTIIVDKKGNIIGDPIIGIQEDYEKAYVKYINAAMRKIGKRKIRLNSDEEEATTEADHNDAKTDRETRKDNETEKIDRENSSSNDDSDSQDNGENEKNSDYEDDGEY